MWVLVLLGTAIGLICVLTIADRIIYKDYPISDEYWMSGLIFIGFLAAMMAMMAI
jgi:hypothetical protein